MNTRLADPLERSAGAETPGAQGCQACGFWEQIAGLDLKKMSSCGVRRSRTTCGVNPGKPRSDLRTLQTPSRKGRQGDGQTRVHHDKRDWNFPVHLQQLCRGARRGSSLLVSLPHSTRRATPFGPIGFNRLFLTCPWNLAHHRDQFPLATSADFSDTAWFVIDVTL